MRLLISLIMVICTTTVAYAQIDERSQDQAEWDLFQARKELLKSVGLPKNQNTLNFLTVELFYNVPDRAVVARGPEDLHIKKMRLSVDYQESLKLKSLFPNWRALNNRSIVLMNAIKISGRSSHFLWDPYQPTVHFIWKSKSFDRFASETRALLKQSRDTLPGVDFDLASEMSLHESTARFLQTDFSSADDQILPLHGFMSSPFLGDLARKHGLSPFEFMVQKLMPHYADFYFSMAYLSGLAPDSHTQNLWIVTKPDGTFHLAAKDFDLFLINPLFVPRPPRSLSRFQAVANLPCENSETCRLTEPSFHFAEFALQTVTHTDRYSAEQQGELVKAFFDRLIARVEDHFKISLRLSLKLQLANEELGQEPLGKNIRRLSVRGGRGPFDRPSGFFAFSEKMVREINTQIYGKIIGERFYPMDPESQDNLEAAFVLAAWDDSQDVNLNYYQMKPSAPSPLTEAPTFKSKFLRDLAQDRIPRFYAWWLEKTEFKAHPPYHYEFSRNFILLVDAKGEVTAMTKAIYLDCENALQ